MASPIPRPVPVDFDPSLPLRVMVDRYHTSKTTAHRWRREVGYTGPGGTVSAWSERDLYLLRTNFNAMTYAQLCELLGRSLPSIKAKANSIGLRKAAGNWGHERGRKFEGQHAKGVADMAAQHLRREAPVFRCNADGQPNPKGKCWRYGNAVLTEEELIAKAERKGWDGDDWRRVGETTVGEAANGVLDRLKVADD